MARGALDISVISAVEYARDAARYLLLPDLAISCDGPVRSVMLFSRVPAASLSAAPRARDAQLDDERRAARAAVRARVGGAADVRAGRCGDRRPRARRAAGARRAAHHRRRRAAAQLRRRATSRASTRTPTTSAPRGSSGRGCPSSSPSGSRCGPRRSSTRSRCTRSSSARATGASPISRSSPTRPSAATGVSRAAALEYLSGLDYGLRYEHLAGLTTFFGKLAASGRVPNGSLVFLPAA